MTYPNTNSTPAPPSTPQSGTPAREASPQQVQQWLRSGECVLIDVREPDEHARERIPGSRLLPLSRFDPELAAAHARPGQRIVIHCRGGRRSSDACRLAASLAAHGSTVINLTGGIDAWKQQSLPVEVHANAPALSVMRQVQLVIGLLTLAGCSLAWLVHPGFIGVPAFLGAGLTVAGATGTCTLATVIAKLPWNRGSTAGAARSFDPAR